MIRLAIIFALLATPALSQTRPSPRPDTLGQAAPHEVSEAQPEEMENPQVAAAPVPQARPAPTASAEELADLRAQFRAALLPCWNVGGLSAEAQQVAILVAFDIALDGVPVRDTTMVREFDNGTQDAADEALGAALRAILRCGSSGFDLPTDSYEQWRRVEVWFDASDVVSLDQARAEALSSAAPSTYAAVSAPEPGRLSEVVEEPADIANVALPPQDETALQETGVEETGVEDAYDPAARPSSDAGAITRLNEDTEIFWQMADLSLEARWSDVDVDVAFDAWNMPSAASIRLVESHGVAPGAVQETFRAALSALAGCAMASDRGAAILATTLLFDRNGVHLR